MNRLTDKKPAETDALPSEHQWPNRKRSLVGACVAHALHDGYTDGLYAFLPVWQMQFGLSYAALAVIRALYYGTMGGFQIPADAALRVLPARSALVLSTLVAAAGLTIMALPFGVPGLCAGLIVAGIGSSIQHPRGSLLVIESYGAASRRPLGIYNFSGDLGKSLLPAIVALLLPLFAWRAVLGLMALLGIACAAALVQLVPGRQSSTMGPAAPARGAMRARKGFGILTAIGALDTATRTGYLLFLPFLIHVRHGGSPTVGIALALLFTGGAFGKATCGWLGQRFGVVNSVVFTEMVTAVLIAATVFTPLMLTLALLPLLGIVLNGTSSILYATVPELVDGDKGRAFAIFYTSVIGAGGVAPILFGSLADHSTQTVGMLAAAATAVTIVPLALALRAWLPGQSADMHCAALEGDSPASR